MDYFTIASTKPTTLFTRTTFLLAWHKDNSFTFWNPLRKKKVLYYSIELSTIAFSVKQATTLQKKSINSLSSTVSSCMKLKKGTKRGIYEKDVDENDDDATRK